MTSMSKSNFRQSLIKLLASSPVDPPGMVGINGGKCSFYSPNFYIKTIFLSSTLRVHGVFATDCPLNGAISVRR